MNVFLWVAILILFAVAFFPADDPSAQVIRSSFAPFVYFVV